MPASYSSLWRFTHLEVHALIGFTRQTLNRVPHNQHKMRITQATSNPLEYLLALHRGKVKNLITIITIGARDNHHPPLNDPRCSKPSRWRQPQVKSAAKHEHQVPLDAITQAMHLDHSQSHYDDESMMEMSGRALAKLKRLPCQ